MTALTSPPQISAAASASRIPFGHEPTPSAQAREHHVLRAAADVEAARLADDRDDERRVADVLGRVDRVGEPLLRGAAHDDELPLLRVARASGQSPRVEDPVAHVARNRRRGVVAHVALRRDREEGVHAEDPTVTVSDTA